MIKIEVKNLNVEDVLFSSACFRATKEQDGSITNILKDRVVNIKQDGNTFKSFVNVCYTNLGGTHLNGLKKTICNIVKDNSKKKILINHRKLNLHYKNNKI